MVAHVKRKDELTPLEFRTYYDTKHVPLLKSLFGSAFPISHTRFYITRSSVLSPATGMNPNEAFPAVRYREGFRGSEVDFDAIAILVFRDNEHFNTFKEMFFQEDIQRKVKDDEKNFQDTGYKMACALEEPVVTYGQ